MAKKRKKAIGQGNVEISGSHIKKYLSIADKSQSELATVLNVNSATLSRWADSSQQTPQRTEFLVLIPLLLSEGVEIIPEPNDRAVESFISAYKEIIAEEALSNPKTVRHLKRKMAIRSNPQIKAARRLYELLRAAWEKIEKDIGLGGAPWPD
jgi:DNA-binding transcriptional regulator YiaG